MGQTDYLKQRFASRNKTHTIFYYINTRNSTTIRVGQEILNLSREKVREMIDFEENNDTSLKNGTNEFSLW